MYLQLHTTKNLFHKIFFFQQKIRQFIQLGIYGGVGFSIIALLKGEPKFYRNVGTWYIRGRFILSYLNPSAKMIFEVFGTHYGYSAPITVYFG